MKSYNAEDYCHKTIRLYKFVSPIGLTSFLQHGDLKISFRNDANDPYEVLPQGEMPGTSSKNILHGFISLSSKYNLPSMWGNYASKYSGACIEFELPYFIFSAAQEHCVPNAMSKLTDALTKEVGWMKTMRCKGEDECNKNGVSLSFSHSDFIFRCNYVKKYRADTSNNFPIPPYFLSIKELYVDFVKKYRELSTKHESWQIEDEYRICVTKQNASRAAVYGESIMFFSDVITRYAKRIILGPKSPYSAYDIAIMTSVSPASNVFQKLDFVESAFDKRSFLLNFIDPTGNPEEQGIPINISE